MRKLILVGCLIASICAYHIQNSEFNVVITDVEYSKIPSNYEFRRGPTLSKDSFSELETIFTRAYKVLEKQPRSGTEAILNDYADKIFVNLQNLLIHNGFDPTQMPDQHSGFNYTLIITYHGELDLTHGWLSDISTIHRGGDVVFRYDPETKYMEVTVPMAFDDMQFTYDYSAKIMGLGPRGGIEGKIANIGIRIKIGFNTSTLAASLDEFYITNSGHITIDFNGNPLVDWLVNLLTNVVTALLKPVILLVVEGIIRGGLDNAIEAINDAINNFLNPTTPIPSTTVASLFYN